MYNILFEKQRIFRLFDKIERNIVSISDKTEMNMCHYFDKTETKGVYREVISTPDAWEEW